MVSCNATRPRQLICVGRPFEDAASRAGAHLSEVLLTGAERADV